MSPHWNLSLQNIWDSSPSSQSLSHLSLREGLSLSERLLSGAIGVGYFGVAPAVADRKCLVKQGCGSWLLYLNSGSSSTVPIGQYDMGNGKIAEFGR